MSSVYDLQSKKNKYYNLIDGLSAITKNLNGSIDNLQQVVAKFSDAFKIDSMSADENKISNYHKELIERNNTIKNVIVPSIYEEINKINMQIEQAESIVEEDTSSNVSYTSTSNTTTTSSTNQTNTSSSSKKQLPNAKKVIVDDSTRLLY